MSWPKLSETLPAPIDMMSCQRCHKECDLERWEEHDDNDQPTGVVICICDDCSKEIIEKHPRLYRELHTFEPHPGSMVCCRECPFRNGLLCNHPALKANGGNGLVIKYPEPTVAHISYQTKGGHRRGRWDKLYHGHPECTRLGMADHAYLEGERREGP